MLRDAAASLPAATWQQMLRAQVQRMRTPRQLALSRGFEAAARELLLPHTSSSAQSSIAPHGSSNAEEDEDGDVCPGRGCHAHPGPPLTADQGRELEEALQESGGWKRAGPDGTPQQGQQQQQRVAVEAFAADAGCDIAVVHGASLTPADFRARFLTREMPVLLRNGSGVRWTALRRQLAQARVVDSYGARSVSVSAVPYHDHGQTPATSS